MFWEMLVLCVAMWIFGLVFGIWLFLKDDTPQPDYQRKERKAPGGGNE